MSAADLRTHRLLLRQFRAGDIDAYASMCADPEVMRHLRPAGEPLSREDILAGNVRSIRLAERLGSRLVGAVTLRGHEHLVYRLDRGAERAAEQGEG